MYVRGLYQPAPGASDRVTDPDRPAGRLFVCLPPPRHRRKTISLGPPGLAVAAHGDYQA